jgi:RNA polymerase sigma factor (sigma-70 family)
MNSSLDYPSLSDRRLVELHLAGDRTAFRQIVERYQAMVCALGLSACGDLGRSEDLAQEVFVAAWKQLPALREPEKLRGWLAGIARNLSHNFFRRQQRTPTARAEPLSVETLSEADSPQQKAISAEEASLLWSALEGIPENYREPMVLFYREHQSMSAVAATLEISEEAARQRLARGRALLSERMTKLVEESLTRSAPTPAFAGVVMLALPMGVGPTVMVAEISSVGGKTAAGTAVKTATTAGSIGMAAAKGGLALKAVSLVAVLPALLGGFEGFLKFQHRNETVRDVRERRRAAWAYFVMQAALGAVMLGFFVVPGSILGKNPPPWGYFLTGLGLIAAIWTFVLAKRRVNREVPAEELTTMGDLMGGAASVFERRSARSFLGLPVWHVRLGSRCGWRLPVMKAWVVIGDGRAIGGLFALGPVAIAPVSMGVGAVGVFTLGVFSLGYCAMGFIAAGWVGAGLAAAGGYAAKGVWVISANLASGQFGWAPHFHDATARAFFANDGLTQFAHYVGQFAIVAGLCGWVAPLVLTGWQLWRTRTRN